MEGVGLTIMRSWVQFPVAILLGVYVRREKGRRGWANADKSGYGGEGQFWFIFC